MNKQYLKYYFNNPELWNAIRKKSVKKETDFLIKLFKESGKIKNILDVGCGTGRHLDILSKNGFYGIGIDSNKVMIKEAHKFFPNLIFYVSDMRNIKLRKKFDAIICLCTVFSYNETNNEVKNTIDSFYKLLNPGGILVLDNINAIGFINRFKFKKHLVEKNPYNSFGLTCRVEHRILGKKQALEETRVISNLKTKLVVQKDKTLFRLFFPQELNFYLENVGFKKVKHFNGFNFKNDSDLESFRLVTVAYK